MHVSTNDLCETNIVFTVRTLAKTQINERSFCATVMFATKRILTDSSNNLVSGRFLVGDAALWRLPGILLLAGISLLVPVRIKPQESTAGILLLPGISLFVPVQSKTDESIKKVLLCRKKNHALPHLSGCVWKRPLRNLNSLEKRLCDDR